MHVNNIREIVDSSFTGILNIRAYTIMEHLWIQQSFLPQEYQLLPHSFLSY